MNHYGYCWGNPVGLVDADGNLPTWAKVAIACGAMDAGYQGVQMTWGKQDHFDTAQNMGAMTNGAVFGGLTATGVGFFGTVAAGGISAAGGNMVTQYQKTGTINSREVATATAGGMLGAGIGYGITKCISYAAGRIGNTGSTGNTCPSEGGNDSVYIPRDAHGNPIPLQKQTVNGQDIPLPALEAEGRPHTVLGGKISSKTGEVYRQSATFPGGTWPTVNGQDVPWSEVHWTDHGTPHHHTSPHQHILEYKPDQGGWIRSGPTLFNP